MREETALLHRLSHPVGRNEGSSFMGFRGSTLNPFEVTSFSVPQEDKPKTPSSVNRHARTASSVTSGEQSSNVSSRRQSSMAALRQELEEERQKRKRLEEELNQLKTVIEEKLVPTRPAEVADGDPKAATEKE
ncbi:unnamed protein product [Vitrella brassicaformis CCMP3155]|uniref:Uncharacterized protein n=1 Tax=Vitrella brassicaformis (strain CCMP3155) TaxID=1169540 RepID=A0A0G4E8B1_VITBC|nr:unnamed protein product [Vitrella brassicaformis CCMP3155]|eukprot:CEL91640.1 unnamed protein product [Vitrella brassicaformis CCMP3155]